MFQFVYLKEDDPFTFSFVDESGDQSDITGHQIKYFVIILDIGLVSEFVARKNTK